MPIIPPIDAVAIISSAVQHAIELPVKKISFLNFDKDLITVDHPALQPRPAAIKNFIQKKVMYIKIEQGDSEVALESSTGSSSGNDGGTSSSTFPDVSSDNTDVLDSTTAPSTTPASKAIKLDVTLQSWSVDHGIDLR